MKLSLLWFLPTVIFFAVIIIASLVLWFDFWSEKYKKDKGAAYIELFIIFMVITFFVGLIINLR